MSEESKANTVEDVEQAFRDAIVEACQNVTVAGEAAPAGVTGSDAEAAASAANVGRGWVDVAVGGVAGLERFRLAHDKVAGSPQLPPGPKLGAPSPDDAAMKLVEQIREEAERGASPVRIAQIIDSELAS